jgi:hypothetical protein
VETTFNKFPFPDFDVDPWFDGFTGYAEEADKALYMTRIKDSVIVKKPTTLTFSGNQLTWTGSWEILIGSLGKRVILPYGPDETTAVINMADGDFLYIELPYALNVNATQPLLVASQVPPNDYTAYVIGARLGGNLILRQFEVI